MFDRREYMREYRKKNLERLREQDKRRKRRARFSSGYKNWVDNGVKIGYLQRFQDDKNYRFSKKDLINTLIAEVTTLIKHQGVRPEQILLMPNSPINESSIDELWNVGKVSVTNLKRSGRFDEGKIHYASINLFKGLEIEILFIIDADRAPNVKTLYTQISRGKNKVYLYSTN